MNRSAVLPAIAMSTLLASCSATQTPDVGAESGALMLMTESYAPQDECSSDPAASEFVSELQSAVAARDTEAVLSLAASDIKLSFGGDYGRVRLREMLNRDEDEIWAELDSLMPLGCALDGERVVLPWYYAQQYHAELDPFAANLVIGDDVPLYATADGNEEVGRLDWAMVELASYLDRTYDADRDSRWHVQTDNGTRGYVEETQLRGLLDYRLEAERRDGNWQIVFFLAGD